MAQLNLWEDAAVELTTVGQLMGTLDYMAPEQAERVGAVDYRADLYALGATLFRLLTGRAPLAASPNMTLLEKVRLLGSQTPPLVSTLRDDCPDDLVQLLQQLLSRDPAARPASAAHVAEALLPLSAGHNLPTLLTHCRERASAEPSLEQTPPTRPFVPTAPPTKPPRRSWLALAWLAPIALFAGIVILLETQKGQLIIESDVAGVKVNLLQDGKVYRQLQVQTGAQSTRLFADKYAIEIDGASDEVAIDQSSVEIRRGGTVVARVQREASRISELAEKQSALLEVAAAHARLDQKIKEVDVLEAELTQRTYEWDQAQNLFPKGAMSQLEHNEKRNRWEQTKAKLKIAQAAVREFEIMLRTKELAIESKVSSEDAKTRESSQGASVVMQPTYAGKTLDQWLEVLKDLDTKTRLTALPGIVQLGKKTEQQVLKRINEALTSAINDVAKHSEWSHSDWRRVPSAEALGELMDCVISLNANEAPFEVLKEGCLLVEGKITSETLVVLYYAYIVGMGDAVCDWLLSENRFQSLDRELAWSALTILEGTLNYQNADFCQALPKLVQDHPQLGLPAMLILWPPTGIAREELTGFEETIARAAHVAFLSDDSSPTVVALSATRLAATTPIVEEFRSELVDKLRKRISALAKDRERLLEALRVGAPGVKLAYPTGTEPIELHTFDTSRSKSKMYVGRRIVGSEMLGMLALAVRLQAIRELDEHLTAAAEPIFEAALPLVVAIQQDRQKQIDWSGFSWPFPEKDIARFNEPLSTFPPDVWRAATIARTIRDLPERVPLFGTKLLQLSLSHFADVQIQSLDKDGDKRLWIQTEHYQPRSGVVDLDRNKFISKEEIISGTLNSLSRSFIGDKLGALGTKPEGFLTKDQAVPGISEATFEAIDKDGDGKITLDEGVNYLLVHPNMPAAVPSQDPQASATATVEQAFDGAVKAWAERQIAKYDKNKDGQLTADEWESMIVKPVAGTDANGDGIITLQEFVASRSGNAAAPKPDSSAAPIYEGKTLGQWLQVFENDLSLPSRLDALKAVQIFTKTMSAEAVQRITQRVLAATDAYQLAHAVNANWRDRLVSNTRDSRSNYASDGQRVLNIPESPAPRVLSYMKSNLSDEQFLKFVQEKLTTSDPKLAAHWMYGVCWNQQDVRDTPYDQLYDWLLEPGRTKSFDPQVARLAVLYFELQVGKKLQSTESDLARVIAEVRSHPDIGIDEALQFEPLTRGQNREAAFSLKRRVDALVGELARQTLARDRATPTEITLAACRLATSRTSLSAMRAELIPLVAKRLKTVAEDPVRLLAKLPLSMGSYWGTSSGSILLQRSHEQAFGLKSYINSEALALLSLVERIKMAKEVESELTSLFTATSPATIEVETKTKVAMPAWSWDDVDLQDASVSPKVDIPLTHWNAAAINRTIEEIRRHEPATLSSGPLAEAEAEQLAKITMLKLDGNHDGQLSYEERQASGSGFANDDQSSAWNNEQLKQALIDRLKARGASLLERAIQMIKEKDKDGDGQLSNKEDTSWSAESFAAIDTDENGLLSPAEYASKQSRDADLRERIQRRSDNK